MRVPVTGLIGRPGEIRPLRRSAEPGAFGDAPWGAADGALRSNVELDLQLDAVVEGILVRGDVAFTLELPCARCLEPQLTERALPVAELFADPTKRDDDEEDDPGYEIVDDLTAIELDTLVRDTVLVDLPLRVLCRDACQGLCPTCGADRNHVDCGHRLSDEPDPRWAKLAELDVPADRAGISTSGSPHEN